MEAVVNQLSAHSKELVETDRKFGDSKKFVRFEIDSNKTGKDQFASAAIFGDIAIEDENPGDKSSSKGRTIPVVIKMEPPMPELRAFFNSPLQFQNEILFYTELLPFLASFSTGRDRPQFAHFLKGSSPDEVLGSYVMMQNASQEGFRLSKDNPLLNLSHFLLTVNRLGRFHGLSYIAKSRNRSKLTDVVGRIQETSWTDSRIANGDIQNDFISASVKRSIGKFDNDGYEQYAEQLARLKKLIVDCPVRFMRDITTPKEPMAVVCHGDFCRNNILFKYGETNDSVNGNKSFNGSVDDSSPSDVLFFDMATIRYASPVMDLSFFIYLNSNAEMRSRHWDQILDSYHQGVRTTVEEYANTHNVDVIRGKDAFTASSQSSTSGIFLPSLEDIHAEFINHALYGFVNCSFFLPMMMEKAPLPGKDSGESDRTAAEVIQEDWWNLPLEEQIRFQNSVGGEEGTAAINDIVEHLFKMKFV
ncbi:hypothetical protein M8J76_011926 [Diaphorina citri]|nr:hypothetical protein M8J76_011926 [Diaphorina citri]